MKNLFQITVLTLLIVMTSCSTNTFSKRKYRKGVFKEYTMRSHEKSIHSDTLFISQQGQLSERASNYLRIDVEDSLVNIASDSNKIKYAAFRMKLKQKFTRPGKRRLHKKWLRDSLIKTEGFNELDPKEQKKKVSIQYGIERRQEITNAQVEKNRIDDSLKLVYPNFSKRAFRKKYKRILKVESKKAQTKTSKTSLLIGIISLLLIMACIIASIFIAISGLFLIFIAIGLVVIGIFLANLFAYRKNKREFDSLAKPSEWTKSAYAKARRFNLITMMIILAIIVGGGILTGVGIAIANSF